MPRTWLPFKCLQLNQKKKVKSEQDLISRNQELTGRERKEVLHLKVLGSQKSMVPSHFGDLLTFLTAEKVGLRQFMVTLTQYCLKPFLLKSFQHLLFSHIWKLRTLHKWHLGSEVKIQSENIKWNIKYTHENPLGRFSTGIVSQEVKHMPFLIHYWDRLLILQLSPSESVSLILRSMSSPKHLNRHRYRYSFQ